MLSVSETYRTILGESSDSGRLCTIIRLSGCHRRCTYCDSAHAFHDGSPMAIEAVVARVRELGSRLVLVTGGEPTLQDDCSGLIAALIADGREVDIEVSGTLGGGALDDLPKGARRIVDVKTPGSGISEDQIDWAGIATLGPRDEIKFVCSDLADYVWSRSLLDDSRLPAAVPKSFSPVHGRLAPADLADWIVADALDVRLQVQLHRVLWPEQDQGV